MACAYNGQFLQYKLAGEKEKARKVSTKLHTCADTGDMDRPRLRPSGSVASAAGSIAAAVEATSKGLRKGMFFGGRGGGFAVASTVGPAFKELATDGDANMGTPDVSGLGSAKARSKSVAGAAVWIVCMSSSRSAQTLANDGR